jgi:hypothetical protein
MSLPLPGHANRAIPVAMFFARVARVPGYAALRKLFQMGITFKRSVQYAGWPATSTVG